ncbi:unnamed protein product [Mytilus edulis]|uniref:Uncharacterized protein n=1 Tax=Mytilus edulis TaxID=6550 RepID=A0A8S3S8J2_MYTED|nr:unnamed protein product [Mytilus edulis]
MSLPGVGNKTALRCIVFLFVISVFMLTEHTIMIFKSFQISGFPNQKYRSQTEDVTLITAYFNIGAFQKTRNTIYSSSTYFNWMKQFEYVSNTVILYTDENKFAMKFKSIRKHFPTYMTKVFVVNQSNLWSFQLKKRLEDIYNQTEYEEYYQNVAIPAYSCAMNTKYELLEKVITENLSTTAFLAWIDIGYFRNKKPGYIKMSIPRNVKDDHVSFSQVDFFNDQLTPTEIVYESRFYIAGGFFIGRSKYLLMFAQDYKLAVEWMIDMNLMNSDQQVLYIMYSPKSPFKPRIPIQTFFQPISLILRSTGRWFYLGKVCQNLI